MKQRFQCLAMACVAAVVRCWGQNAIEYTFRLEIDDSPSCEDLLISDMVGCLIYHDGLQSLSGVDPFLNVVELNEGLSPLKEIQVQNPSFANGSEFSFSLSAGSSAQGLQIAAYNGASLFNSIIIVFPQPYEREDCFPISTGDKLGIFVLTQIKFLKDANASVMRSSPAKTSDEAAIANDEVDLYADVSASVTEAFMSMSMSMQISI